MNELVARPDTVAAWIRDLAQKQAVFFPQRAGERSFRFAPVSATSVIDLAAYLPTIVPPGKQLLPAVDELMQFRQQQDRVEVHPVLDTGHRVLCGVRSCDLRAIGLMDKVQADGVRDPHYWARRSLRGQDRRLAHFPLAPTPLASPVAARHRLHLICS